MEFDIDNDSYLLFIEGLRELLSDSISNRIYVLVPQTMPLMVLDVQLTAGDHSIIVRIDQRTLYILGYSRDGGIHFWEFSGSFFIPESQSLGYFGTYPGARGLTNTARIERENLPLGFHPLQHAIISLNDIEDPNVQRLRSARSLLIIIQMIAESARIKLITGHIIRYWWNAERISPRMVLLQNAWIVFSQIVQRVDMDLPDSTELPNAPNPNDVEINNIGDVRSAFGILLHYSVDED